MSKQAKFGTKVQRADLTCHVISIRLRAPSSDDLNLDQLGMSIQNLPEPNVATVFYNITTLFIKGHLEEQVLLFLPGIIPPKDIPDRGG